MPKRHLYIIVLLLTFFGGMIFLYKAFYLNYPLAPDHHIERWNIEVKVAFEADNSPVKIALYLPRYAPYFKLVDERFASKGYGIISKQSPKGRKIIWTKRLANDYQTLYYRAQILSDEFSADNQTIIPPPILNNKKLNYSEAEITAIESILEQVKSKTADLESQVSELFKLLHQAQEETIVFLTGKDPELLDILHSVKKILNYDNVEVKIIQGIKLADQANARFSYWLEVYDNQTWQAVDPRTGQYGIGSNYLAWKQGSDPIVSIKGGHKRKVTITTSKETVASIDILMQKQKTEPNAFFRFSLLNLPLSNQAVFKIILTIPVGIMILAIFRNIIGIKMFGTFMPVLIALAFRETNLLYGLILFIIIVMTGLLIRFYLTQLKLLLVPRLASVLIIVIILILILSILTHLLNLPKGLFISLFPIVIITMTIERMSIVWEEYGAGEAIQQGLGSLLTACCCYWFMNLSEIEHLLFLFPELLLLCLAFTLLLGRYTGYRLSELSRFRQLAK